MAKISEAISHLPPELPFFSLEFFPPKTPSGLSNLYPRLQRLRTLNPLFICITYSAGGTTASKSLDLADFCQNQLGFRTCLHLTCTNARRGNVDFVLEQCRELGIRNILALRGDEPREGEYGLDPQSHEPTTSTGTDYASSSHEAGSSSHNPSSTSSNNPKDPPAPDTDPNTSNPKFEHAIDLIRYIRRQHGSYFCIGAAAYAEGHPVSSPSHPGGYFQSPEHDLPYLAAKVEAGAEFLITQLFYDAERYLDFENMVREYDGGKMRDIPLVPGLMPLQGWGSFTRTCKLARVGVPEGVLERLRPWKADDDAVKRVGVGVVTDIVRRIRREGGGSSTGSETKGGRRMPRGFHFYTLNLEKALAQILEGAGLIQAESTRATEEGESAVAAEGEVAMSGQQQVNKHRRKSSAHNRVVVARVSQSNNGDYEASEALAGQRRKDEQQSSEDALAIAEGEGSLGRAATWDDFPNGRWGDARSPAYAPTNNYNLHPNLSRTPALRLWSRPTSRDDITDIFRRYLLGKLAAIPWSEEDSAVEEASQGLLRDSDPQGGLRPETALIKDELLGLNQKGWWTIASQPAVNAAKSGDDVVGWGPRKGGFVWQKPFVEFFLPSADWTKLKDKLDAVPSEATYFAGNAAGEFEATDEKSVNPVTWGVFRGKEIITPTIVEAVSFRAWQSEAFDIWREWQMVFPPASPSAKLLQNLGADAWLVNVIGHEYMEGKRLWKLLLED